MGGRRFVAATRSGFLAQFLDHVGPAIVFSVTPISTFASLAKYLVDDRVHHPTVLLVAYVVQRAMTITFSTLVVALFLARRPVIGRRAPILSRIVALAGTFALQELGASPVPEDQPVRVLVSSVLIAVGFAIAIAGIATLRRNFGIFPEARGLVTSGLYRYVRHPLYCGEIIAGFGIALGTTSFAVFGLFATQCALLYWRSVLEERALTEIFPEYQQYQRTTQRVIPGIF